jgi:hypothetical protein
MNETFFLLCGIFNFGFVIFHIFFWKIFRWKADLRSLTPANRGIMQVMNLCLIYLFLCFGAATIYYRSELLTIELGKIVLISISIFWFLRAVGQLIFFDIKGKISQIFFVVFIAGGMLHLLPLIV